MKQASWTEEARPDAGRRHAVESGSARGSLEMVSYMHDKVSALGDDEAARELIALIGASVVLPLRWRSTRAGGDASETMMRRWTAKWKLKNWRPPEYLDGCR